MYISRVVLIGIGLSAVTAIGFTDEVLLVEGSDNSDKINYKAPAYTDAVFAYVQISTDYDQYQHHTQIFQDFQDLTSNLGSAGIPIIPRVRYGEAGNEQGYTPEPDNQATIIRDVTSWAKELITAKGKVDIPVVQAGFLGDWGEWHGGTYCPDTPSQEIRQVQKQIVQILQTTGLKVALRDPRDHKALFPGSRTVTLHDDCIFDGGPTGDDGGTFTADDGDDRQGWVDYVKQVASGNTFGGEGCDDATDAKFDWSAGNLCSSNGLKAYIDAFQISYLKNTWPDGLVSLLGNAQETACVEGIQAALRKYS